MLAIFVVAGLAAGLIIGRWWAPVPIAISTGLLLWFWGRDGVLEAGLQHYVTALFTLATALGALAGVAIRRFANPS